PRPARRSGPGNADRNAVRGAQPDRGHRHHPGHSADEDDAVSVVTDIAMTPQPESVATSRRSGSVLRDALRLCRTRIGLVLVVGLTLLAGAGPFFAPHSPSDFAGPPFSNPSSAARFGTDYLGQDVLSLFLWGGREILVMAVLATAFGIILGAIVGLLAAYSRNWLDDVLMRGIARVPRLPPLRLALVAIATVGPK